MFYLQRIKSMLEFIYAQHKKAIYNMYNINEFERRMVMYRKEIQK